MTFPEEDYIYLKEMTVGFGKSKKFCNRWRGPYLITRRFYDSNNQIQIKPGKHTTVNVNRMKKCHKLPGKAENIKKRASITPEREFSDDDWNDSDNLPLHLLGRPRQISSLPGEIQNSGSNSTESAPVNDVPTQIHVETHMTPSQEGQNDEGLPVEIIGTRICPLQGPKGQFSETAGLSQTQDSVEGGGSNQDQPYPYFLRLLPGRRNYRPVESAND